MWEVYFNIVIHQCHLCNTWIKLSPLEKNDLKFLTSICQGILVHPHYSGSAFPQYVLLSLQTLKPHNKFQTNLVFVEKN
jgi:hypothetical protein